jgi:hypothetical protein
VTLAAAQAAAANASAGAVARVLRSTAQQLIERARLDELRATPQSVLGNGIACEVVALAGEGLSRASVAQIRKATQALAMKWLSSDEDRRRSAVQPALFGSVILDALLEHLGVNEISVEA